MRPGKAFTFEDFFTKGDDNHRLLLVLSTLEDDALMAKLESERKGWRNHYPVRMLWQSLIATKIYGIPTTNGLIRKLRRDGKYLKFRCPKHSEELGGPCSMSRYGRVLKIPNRV